MSRPPSVALAAGLSAGGLVVGHALGYLLAEPDPALRDAHLAATGHGGFGLLAGCGLLAAVLAAAWSAARASAGTPARLPGTPALATVQVAAFAAIEVVERGFSPSAAASDRAVWIGLALQVLVALAVSAFLRRAVRTARSLARGALPLRPPRAGALPARPLPTPPLRRPRPAVRLRAPPSASPA
jgi:hypothetical protein